MKAGALDHPKMHRLARILGIPRYAAWGLMEGLWNFATRYAPAGNVGKYPNQDLSDAVAWDSEPDKLISAMVVCGWLDRHETERLIIHDWAEHAPDYIKKREKKGEFKIFRAESGISQIIPEKKESNEGEEKILPENSGKFQNVSEKTGLPNQTKPSQTMPSQTKPCLPEAVATENTPVAGKPGESAGDSVQGKSLPAQNAALQGNRDAARSAPTPGTCMQNAAQPPSAGAQGKPPPSPDPTAGDAWNRRRTLLWQELSRILKLSPTASGEAEQTAYIRGCEAIRDVLIRLHDSATAVGRRWDGKRGIEAMLRDYARQARDGNNPVGLWLHKCRESWPEILNTKV